MVDVPTPNISQAQSAWLATQNVLEQKAAAQVCRAELISRQFSLAVLITRAATFTTKTSWIQEAIKNQLKDP